MGILDHMRRRLSRLWIPALLTGVIGYFGYHAVQGEHGILAWHKIQQDLAVAQGKRDSLSEERQQLAHRVLHLRSDSLDPDLLDEQARRILNFGRPDERIILLERAESLPSTIN